MLHFASRVDSLKSSATMDISAKAQELKAKGHDVIGLAAGEPDFDTPETIRAAAVQALADGITRYTPAPGFLSLREAIAEKVRKDYGFDTNADEIVVTCGAKHAIYLALQCLVGPGDAVLLPTPAWVSYAPMIELTGGTVIPLPLHEEDNFQVNVDRWKGLAIPPNARGIIINSPNNPTGAVYTKDQLKRLAGWAMQRNLWILSDEIYDKVTFEGNTHTSIASLGPEVKAMTITVNGFSKSHCMTGWRLGWSVSDPELAKKMANLQSQSNSHVTSFVQWAGLAAAKLPNHDLEKMVKEFDARRQYCCERLSRLSKWVSYSKPQGAFYLFINLSKWLHERQMSDVEFAKNFLASQYVGTVPGSAFGKQDYIRISYATSLANLKKAFDRLEAFLSQK
jgi:aspartate aminotransferase